MKRIWIILLIHFAVPALTKAITSSSIPSLNQEIENKCKQFHEYNNPNVASYIDQCLKQNISDDNFKLIASYAPVLCYGVLSTVLSSCDKGSSEVLNYISKYDNQKINVSECKNFCPIESYDIYPMLAQEDTLIKLKSYTNSECEHLCCSTVDNFILSDCIMLKNASSMLLRMSEDKIKTPATEPAPTSKPVVEKSKIPAKSDLENTNNNNNNNNNANSNHINPTNSNNNVANNNVEQTKKTAIKIKEVKDKTQNQQTNGKPNEKTEPKETDLSENDKLETTNDFDKPSSVLNINNEANIESVLQTTPEEGKETAQVPKTDDVKSMDEGDFDDNDPSQPLDTDTKLNPEKEDNAPLSATSLPETSQPLQPTYEFEEAEDSHFFIYFLTSASIVILAYVAFHNKNKILAYALEGRRSRNNRRRPNSANYRKLDCNLEEAITSNTSHTSVTSVVY